MDAKYLMQFDWVCLEDDPTPRQVDFIMSGEVGLYWNRIVTPPYIKPIPLTTEILEKNGFIKKERRWILLDSYTKDKIIVLLKVANGFALLTTEGMTLAFQYVHELQHFYKLCGINKEIVL